MTHNWEYKPVSEIFETVTDFVAAGSFADLRDNVIYNSEKDFAQLIRTTDLKNNFSNQQFVYVNEHAFNYLWRVNLSEECIILPNIGNCGEVYYLHPSMLAYPNNVLGPNAIMVRSGSHNQKYLAFALKGSYFQRQLSQIVSQVAQSKFNKTNLKKLLLPVPPIEVQEQIVAELDKINEVIDDCRELLRNLDALAQSLFYDYFSDIHENVALSYYVNALVGGKSLAGKEFCINRVLKSSAVTYDYFDKDSTKFLPPDYIPTPEHLVKVGDVIISRMNTAELVGACAYVFDVDDNVFLPDRLWRIEYKTNANPIFLWKSLISESSKEQIRRKASGTSGSMKNISKPLLLSVQIKKVPLKLQEKFAERIEQIDAQKKTVEETIANMQTLLDSRMDYWFN